MTNLGTLNGYDCSGASHINSKGQIVGGSYLCAIGPDGPSHGFLWQNGFMTDLNAFVAPGSALTLSGGAFINNRGEIAGVGVLPDGDVHAVLLLPCAEGTEGCMDAVEGTGAASHAPVDATAQHRFTPEDISRIRALPMTKNRSFMTKHVWRALPPH